MEIIAKNGSHVAVLDRTEFIDGVQDFLDRMADARYSDCIGLVAYTENLGEQFFELRTRYAGELMQKCSNYGFRLAVVGDFSRIESKSLRGFIYECNNGKGNPVSFQSSVEQALDSLTA
jgi:hypothetical protein